MTSHVNKLEQTIIKHANWLRRKRIAYVGLYRTVGLHFQIYKKL